MLLALLWERGQRVLYVPGIAVDRARDAYRGESKTDARDARLIAEQARVRRDLSALQPGEELLAELKLLVAHRRDLVLDQARAIVRLREALVSLFLALSEATKAAKFATSVRVGRRFSNVLVLARSASMFSKVGPARSARMLLKIASSSR